MFQVQILKHLTLADKIQGWLNQSSYASDASCHK